MYIFAFYSLIMLLYIHSQTKMRSGKNALIQPLCNSYLSVNLQTIINNMQSIQEDIGPDVECIPCVGRTMLTARVLKFHCQKRFAPTRTCAPSQLRRCGGRRTAVQAGLSAPAVLVLGGVPERLFPAAVEYGLQLTVFHPSTVYALENWPPRRENAPKYRSKLKPAGTRTGAKPGAELARWPPRWPPVPHVRTMGGIPHFSTGETKESPNSLPAVSTLSAGFGTASGRRHRSATEAHVQQRRQRLVPRLVLQRSTHRAPAVYG